MHPPTGIDAGIAERLHYYAVLCINKYTNVYIYVYMLCLVLYVGGLSPRIGIYIFSINFIDTAIIKHNIFSLLCFIEQ